MSGHRPFFVLAVNIVGFKWFFVNHFIEQGTDAGFCPAGTEWHGDGFDGYITQSCQINGDIATCFLGQAVNIVQQYSDVIMDGQWLQAYDAVYPSADFIPDFRVLA